MTASSSPTYYRCSPGLLLILVCIGSFLSLYVSVSILYDLDKDVITEFIYTEQSQQPQTTQRQQPHVFPVMDIISIGSNTRPSTVQQETFARHLAVRHFWRFTEDDDESDWDCAKQLTHEDAKAIAAKCHSDTMYSEQAHLLAKHFASEQFLLKHPPGWLCAQKRPIDALAQVGTFYKQQQRDLPDYLWILDDDSWLHIDNILPVLARNHPVTEAHVVAGCLIRSQFDLHLSWYWGGFGTVLTRSSLQRLLVDLDCSQQPGDVNYFVQHACAQIDRNLIGEQDVFHPNMDLLQLMQAYATSFSYVRHDEWKDGAGYCLHSDTMMAYWLNFYHIADSAVSLDDGDVTRREWMKLPRDGTNPKFKKNQHLLDQVPTLSQVPHYDRIRGYNHTSIHKTRKWMGKIYRSFGQCAHQTVENCTHTAHVCHYIPDTHMKALFDSIVYKDHPELYHGSSRAVSQLK